MCQIAPFSSNLGIGFGQVSAGNMGIFVGTDGVGAGTKCGLWRFDGGTSRIQLAAETGNSINNVGLTQIDMQVIGGSHVNIYVNKVLVISFTEGPNYGPPFPPPWHLFPIGMSAMDCAAIFGTGSSVTQSSEIIVADTDTRDLSLVTMPTNGAGDNNNWDSGTYQDIGIGGSGFDPDKTSIDDATYIEVATTGKDFQARHLALPLGFFRIEAVKVAVRAQVESGSACSSIKLGVRESGTNYLDSGHTLTPAATWLTAERLMTTDPATSAAWTQNVINPLQLELQSA